MNERNKIRKRVQWCGGCKPCMANDVADVILFLASDESRALTGQIIVSDFGADL